MDDVIAAMRMKLQWLWFLNDNRKLESMDDYAISHKLMRKFLEEGKFY